MSFSILFLSSLSLYSLFVLVIATGQVNGPIILTNLINSFTGSGGSVTDNLTTVSFNAGQTGTYTSNIIAFPSGKNILDFQATLTQLSGVNDFIYFTVIGTTPNVYTFSMSTSGGNTLYQILVNGSPVTSTASISLNANIRIRVYYGTSVQFFINNTLVRSATTDPLNSYQLQISGGGGTATRTLTNNAAYAS